MIEHTALLARADRLHEVASAVQRAVAFREATVAGGRGRVFDTAERFRRRLDRLELAAVRTVLDEWGRVRRVLDVRISELDELLKGDEPAIAYEQARQRLAAQRDGLVRQVDDYARHVEAGIHQTQAQAADLAADGTATVVRQQLGPDAARAGVTFDRLPATAVEQMLGQLQAGPLRDLMGRLGGEFADTLRAELVDGMVLGRNPRTTARRMMSTVDMPRWRAMNIARTELLRAYRETSRRSLADSQVVEQVKWSAALDARTCPACWARHGQTFPKTYTMVTHVNCRCALLPVAKSWEELGIPGVADSSTTVDMVDGPTLFARQPVAVQRSVLGPAKWAAFNDGMFDLEDVIKVTHDPDWGGSMQVRPLADLIRQ